MKSKTRYAILGMLSIEPMSGYDMRQAMKTSTAYFWSESDGQIYPTLAALQKTKSIKVLPTKNISARDKKVYQITPQGRKELQAWLVLEPETQTVRSELMLKLFFGANVAPVITREHIEAQRYQTKTSLQQLQQTRQQLMQQEKNSPHLPYWLMSIDHGLRAGEARLEWCEASIRTLAKME